MVEVESDARPCIRHAPCDEAVTLYYISSSFPLRGVPLDTQWEGLESASLAGDRKVNSPQGGEKTHAEIRPNILFYVRDHTVPFVD